MNLNTVNLEETLTAHPWDSGTGKKMLFLKRRYYVYDSEHKLLDGGALRYNSTIGKIFVRNEDLRGELFVAFDSKHRIHLKGYVNSKLAGRIDIDNHLEKYDRDLKAPLSRVARVERYLNINDIYKNLYTQEEIDSFFIRDFEANLLFFSPDQAKQLYIKLAQYYFQNFYPRVLQSITLYFSSYGITEKLYEELFMFVMGIQTVYENGYLNKEDLDFFVHKVKDRLIDAYDHAPSTVSVNLINEVLLYFNLYSPRLPRLDESLRKLYDKDVKTQKEYAFYLVLMKERVKKGEKDIYSRLVRIYQEEFFEFRARLTQDRTKRVQELSREKLAAERPMLLALIEALGNCESEAKETHILLLFFLFQDDERVREFAREALLKCKAAFELSLEGLSVSDEILLDQIEGIMGEGD